MITFFMILFFLTTCFLTFTTYGFYKENVSYEEWTEEASQKIQDILISMERIDEGGAFQSDDEVGDVFTSLREVINELKILV